MLKLPNNQMPQDTQTKFAPPALDLSDPKSVVSEIFDDDRWIKDEFAKHLSTEILAFSEVFSETFKRFPALDRLSSTDNEQAAFVAGFVHGVIDDLITSMKLLVSGKMLASGNLMRQAIEGVAVAILCASAELISVLDKKRIVRIKYWTKLKAGNSLVSAHLSISQLELNREQLGINTIAIERLKSSRKRYHLFSHPGYMGLATRMGLGEPLLLFVGGSFDEAKLPAYKTEIEERTNFCKILPNLMDGLIERLEKTGSNEL